jgi:uncharacterized protein (TIRG00374 family)
MSITKWLIQKRRFLLIVVGIIVFLCYFYFFVPITEVVEILHSANPFYFILAFCALLASVTANAFAWQRLLHIVFIKASFIKSLQYLWVENFVDLVVPGEPISGEVSRIYLMSKGTGAGYGKVLASAVAHRIATTSVTAVGLLVNVLYFAFVYRPPLFVLEFASVLLLGDAIVIGLLFYVGARKSATQRLADWAFNVLKRLTRGHWRFERRRERTLKMIDLFHEGMATLGTQRKDFILPLCFTAISWFLDISIAILVFLCLASVGTGISMSAIVIVYSLTGTIQYLHIGVIPGEVGLAEIVMTTLFTLVGSQQYIAVFALATLLIRCLTFWMKLFIGGIVVQLLGIKNFMQS